MGRQATPRVPLLIFDFDGVLHEFPKWQGRFGRVDLTVIHMAHARGYVVAIVTANDVRNVAREVRAAGVDAKSDRLMRRSRWDGGRSRRVVLVTQRKLAGNHMFVDDRAFMWKFGDDPREVFAELDRRGLTATKKGLQP
jgi:hypothetical protein